MWIHTVTANYTLFASSNPTDLPQFRWKTEPMRNRACPGQSNVTSFVVELTGSVTSVCDMILNGIGGEWISEVYFGRMMKPSLFIV